MKLGVLVALSIVASGCVKRFECALHGGVEVRSITTEHFVVTSGLPLEAHRVEAEHLELLWDTFAAFFHTDIATARIPVLVLDDTDAVESFASGYAGFVIRRGPDVLVVGAPAAPKATNVNAHELAHLVSYYLLPRQPRWLAEGLGTYFEDATFKDARTVTMGRWNAPRAEEAFQLGVLSLDELAKWGGLRFGEDEGRYYASAWAWVHYLSNHDEPRLARLFDALRGQRPLDEVMREVFPPADRSRLQKEVQAYLGAARFRGFETALRRTPVLSAPEVLLPWQLHLLRGRLFLNDEKAAALEEALAVKVAPSPVPAAIAVLEATRKTEPIAPLLERFPASAAVLVGLPTDDAKNVLPAFEEALRHERQNAALLEAAAQAWLAAGKLKEAEAFALEGLTLAPWSADLAVVPFSVAIAEGRCAEAETRLARVEPLLPERPTEASTKFLEKARAALVECASPKEVAPR